ncbi:unnamed protein product [Hymenolepis diminuta]|uniref:Uncharacterized protein n=1 Tax=Hymenolepis diminuta TaxID=6216 RepID=A0A564Z0Q1_HYMDI|nr:unnamed protein product [Hymenolepis diminuta]
MINSEILVQNFIPECEIDGTVSKVMNLVLEAKSLNLPEDLQEILIIEQFGHALKKLMKPSMEG